MKNKVLASLLALPLLSSCNATTNSATKGYVYENSDKYQVGTSASFASVTSISVMWMSGKVELLYKDTDKVDVEEKANQDYPSDSLKLHYYQDGETLNLQYSESGCTMENLTNFKKTLTVSLPRSLALSSLLVDSMSASVDSSVSIASLSYNGMSGDLTSTGDVQKVDSKTMSGSSSVWNKGNLASFSSDSMSGDTILYQPSDAGFSLDFDTMSGKLVNGFDSTSKNKFSYLDSKTVFTCDSMSGDCAVKKI